MTRLISVILSLTMLFGAGAVPSSNVNTVTANVPVTVGKQQAVYEKWTTKSKVGYANIKTQNISGFITEKVSYPTTLPMYINNGVSEEKGIEWVYKDGRAFTSESSLGRYTVNYYMQVSPTKGYFVTELSSYGNSSNATVELYYNSVVTCDKVDIFDKASYIIDVVSDYGSLPVDSKHSDGYWYVFKNLVED